MKKMFIQIKNKNSAGLLRDAVLTCIERSLFFGLTEEVCTTPKPGLVDLNDSGSHRDMNVNTFEKSTRAVLPYLVKMTDIGLYYAQESGRIFPEIRKTGKAAERAMLDATGGVNTHKGAVFTLGILASMVGCMEGKKEEIRLQKLFSEVRKEVSLFLREDFERMARGTPKTHGEILFQKYGIRGIRGEALNGFPSLAYVGIPAMKKAVREQPDLNAAKLYVLLSLMSSLTDTNILTRAGFEALDGVKKQAGKFLNRYAVINADAIHELEQMNREYIRRNISPGGSADLLAAVLFLTDYLAERKKLNPGKKGSIFSDAKGMLLCYD